MNKSAVSFIFGVAVGAAGTWFVLKKKYEIIAQEEIDSVKEVFSRSYTPITPETNNDISEDKPVEEKAKAAADKPNIMEYATKLKKEGYVDYSNNGKDEEEEKETIIVNEDIEVISPDDFGTSDNEYELITLTYFRDDVLVDDADNELTFREIEAMVGEDFADHFGEYEEDSVYIRNHARRTEYEILKDNRTFEEFAGYRSHKSEE